MKHIAAGLMALIAISGCRTTEENYRQAYEIAAQKRNEGLTAEEISGMAREEAMPKTLFRNDSIALKAQYLAFVSNEAIRKQMGTQRLGRYNVVVARFKQEFNALSVLKRLQQGGYSGSSVLTDAEKQLYVSCYTTASLDSAVAVMKQLTAPVPGHPDSISSPVYLRPPFPYILENARLK